MSHGDSKEVEVVFDSALEPYLKITYSRLTGNLNLNIADLPRKMKNRELKPVKVYLEMDRISSIGLSGAAEATFDGNFTERIDIDLSGACNMKCEGSYRFCDIACSGSSDVVVSGKADKLTFEGSGASTIKARNLEARTAEVKLTGSCTLLRRCASGQSQQR